ncbi:hypothetical protein E2C01_024566 [Portunus trituberculatus]|uniref:Uncharacterized protein n=1 Tax=Portunus trituberculatus TaxID=210409 RepID=A0A5B7EAZ8_PORTR|nr:hypothetical protein [Portunus trituberculatus]
MRVTSRPRRALPQLDNNLRNDLSITWLPAVFVAGDGCSPHLINYIGRDIVIVALTLGYGGAARMPSECCLRSLACRIIVV